MALQFSYTAFFIRTTSIKQHNTQPNNNPFILEFHPLIQPQIFLASLAATVKMHAKA